MGPPAYDGTKHAAGTHGLRWGPNNVVSSGCRDGSVALWDPNTKTNMILGGGHDGDADPTGRWVRCTAWSPDGSLLASGGPRRVCVWTAEGELKCSLNLASATAVAENEDDPEPYYVLGLCWVDDATLAIGGGSHDVAVWKLEEGNLRFSLACHDHEDSIRCLAACNGRLASGSDDCTVRVWDGTPAPSDIITRGFGAAVTCVCWSPDGALLAAGSADSSVRVARAEAGRQFGAVAWVWRGNAEKVTAGVASIDFSRDGTRLAVAAEGRVFVFGGVLDATLGDMMACIDAPGLRYDVQFAPDGRQLVYGRSLKREPVASDNVGDEWPVAFVDAPLIDDDPY